jgi:hypothetical protein
VVDNPGVTPAAPHRHAAPHRTALEKALIDLARGDLAKARRRLTNYLVDKPEVLDARSLLAEVYRREGYPDQAGRWGYLVEGGSTAAERELYERACAHRAPRTTPQRHVLTHLRWPADLVPDDPYAAATLARLAEAVRREEYESSIAGTVSSFVARLARGRRAAAEAGRSVVAAADRRTTLA